MWSHVRVVSSRRFCKALGKPGAFFFSGEWRVRRAGRSLFLLLTAEDAELAEVFFAWQQILEKIENVAIGFARPARAFTERSRGVAF